MQNILQILQGCKLGLEFPSFYFYNEYKYIVPRRGYETVKQACGRIHSKMLQRAGKNGCSR